MAELKVVYTDKRESRPDYKDIAWVEYNSLQWLDEAENRVVKSSALPITVHIAPKQMRIDLLFPENSQIMPKRLYSLAIGKSLTPSLMPTPIKTSHGEQKGLLLSIQGERDQPEAMHEFLASSEMREILPTDAIQLMSLELM